MLEDHAVPCVFIPFHKYVTRGRSPEIDGRSWRQRAGCNGYFGSQDAFRLRPLQYRQRKDLTEAARRIEAGAT